VTELDHVDPSWAVQREQAEMLAASTIIPAAYQGKPSDIITAALYGREIGMGPVTALSHINIIQGKATLSAEGMVAVVRAAGHSITGKSSPHGARVHGRRRDNGDEMTLEFTEADRARAGLNTKPWQQYPKAMFWARAVSQLCRELFPDVLSGLSYIAEEIGGEAHPADLAHSPTEIEPLGPRLETIRSQLNDLSPERRSAVRTQMRTRELPESVDMMTSDELDEMEAIVGDAGAGAFDEPFPITDAELVDE
jgi:hypothetical protein